MRKKEDMENIERNIDEDTEAMESIELMEDTEDIKDMEGIESIKTEEETSKRSHSMFTEVSNWLSHFPFILRIGIIFSFVGFFLAFFVGLLSGVNWITFLWKTIVSSFLFFLLGLGVAFVMDRFFGRHFFESDSSHDGKVGQGLKLEEEMDGEENSELGSQVDYWEKDITDLKDLNSSEESRVEDREERLPEQNFPDDPEQLAQAIKTIYHRDKTD